MKLIVLPFVLLAASTSFAQSFKCNMSAHIVDENGYIKADNSRIEIIIPADSKITGPYNSKCATYNNDSLEVRLCAGESRLIGGYIMTYNVNVKGLPSSFNEANTSQVSFVTPKEDSRLFQIHSDVRVLENVKSSLLKAQIAQPENFLLSNLMSADDYDELSFHVSRGMKVGVLKPNDPIYVALDNCSIK